MSLTDLVLSFHGWTITTDSLITETLQLHRRNSLLRHRRNRFLFVNLLRHRRNRFLLVNFLLLPVSGGVYARKKLLEFQEALRVSLVSTLR